MLQSNTPMSNMLSSSPFVINDIYKISRHEEPRISTPGQLRDRLHYLRDVRSKKIHRKRKVLVLPAAKSFGSFARQSSFDIKVMARVSQYVHPVSLHHSVCSSSLVYLYADYRAERKSTTLRFDRYWKITRIITINR